MLPSLNINSKNIPEAKQMSMMRQYINDLKNDMESELFDIKWENLSKPLREKLEGYEVEIVAANDLALEVNANSVTTEYLSANYISAAQIAATYVSTAYLEANYVTADVIASTYVTTNYLTSNYITASSIASTYVTTDYLASNYVKASAIDADYIAGKFVVGNGAVFDRLNVRTDLAQRITGLRLQYADNYYARVELEPHSTVPNRYNLVVDFPP